MKFVCVDNTSGNARHLELWRVYDIDIFDINHEYYILNIDPYIIESNLHRRLGNLKEVWVSKKAFITLDEFRQIKINQIGI